MLFRSEVDVRGFFDNIDHDILLGLLARRIDDPVFIGLIGTMLKAGCMDDWKFERTYSGTPQGGVISPLLANIYLHELDQFMEEMRSEEHTSELQSLMRISYAVFCLKKKTKMRHNIY